MEQPEGSGSRRGGAEDAVEGGGGGEGVGEVRGGGGEGGDGLPVGIGEGGGAFEVIGGAGRGRQGHHTNLHLPSSGPNKIP